MDHNWPDELVRGSTCSECGLEYSQWDERTLYCKGANR